MMSDITLLLARCGVETEGAKIYTYPTRRSASTYPVAQDGVARTEVRLALPDGLSFVERVGYRYCVDKTMRASAAAVYWRMISGINRQRLWMSSRLTELHAAQGELSFTQARRMAATELMEREPAVSPHYSLLEGLIASRDCHRPRRARSSHCIAIAATSPRRSGSSPSLVCASGSLRYSRAGRLAPASATASKKRR